MIELVDQREIYELGFNVFIP